MMDAAAVPVAAADPVALARNRRLAAALPDVTFLPALSDDDGAGWSGERGLVTDVIERRYPSLDGFDAYLAGPPPMIEATVPLLTRLGVRPANVRFDAFVPSVP